MLEIEYAMQYAYAYILLVHITISKPIGDENSEHCLWFLLTELASKKCGNYGPNLKDN